MTIANKTTGNRQTLQGKDIFAEKFINNEKLCLNISTLLVYNGWRAVAQGPRNTVNGFFVITPKNNNVLPKVIRYAQSDPRVTSDYYFSYWYSQSCNFVECLYDKGELSNLSGIDWDFSFATIKITECNFSACGLNIYSWLNEPYEVSFDFET